MTNLHNQQGAIRSPDRRAYRINDFCRAFGLGRTAAYKLIRDGKLSSVVIGGRRLIPADQAEALLKGDHS